MALTTTEEALVRQLLEQQAAILSLADAESTIISKLGATKVTIADLTSAATIGDADLFLIRQGTTEKNVAGAVVKALASSSVAGATETSAGIVELATAAETQAGIDNTRAVHAAGLASLTSTETRAGLIELATAAEAQSFTANKAIDGAKLASAFGGANQSLATSGYQKLPGGLIIQWGVTTLTGGASYTTVTLPIAYTTTHFGVYGNAVENVGGSSSEAIEFGARNLANFEALCLSGVSPVNSKFNWFSIGI